MAFIKGMTLGQYIPAVSILHRLDPRCKIFMTVVVMAALFMCNGFNSLIIWSLLLAFIVKMSKIPLSAVLRSARPIFLLIIITSFLHLFMTDGETVLFGFGAFKATREGAVMAVKIGLRLYLLVLYASLLTLTTSPSELSDGLESILNPLKRFSFPAHEIAMMMTIALRFIPTLFEETERILNAQASRGASFDTGGLIARAKAYIPVLIPLFVLVFKRADVLSFAMESRCYRGGKGRVRMYPLKWGRMENIALIIFMFYIVSILVLDKVSY